MEDDDMNEEKEINKDEIESLIPHRKPFLLIDKLVDIVPGRINETWFKAEKEGVYYGQCSELCGN